MTTYTATLGQSVSGNSGGISLNAFDNVAGNSANTSQTASGLSTTGKVSASSVDTDSVTNSTDAATVGQVNAGHAATLASANAYTDTSVSMAATRAAADTALQNNINAEAPRVRLPIRRCRTISTPKLPHAWRPTRRKPIGASPGMLPHWRAPNCYTDSKVKALGGELRDRIASSTATAIAVGGAAILPDTNFTLAGNVGFYQGAQAIAANAAARVAPHTYLTGAFGGGLNKHGEVGGRVGFVFGF